MDEKTSQDRPVSAPDGLFGLAILVSTIGCTAIMIVGTTPAALALSHAFGLGLEHA